MRRLTVFLLICIVGFASTLTAQDKFDAASRAKLIAPFIDAQTLGVGHLDLTRVDVKALFAQLAAIQPDSAQGLAEPEAHVTKMFESLKKAGAKEVFLVVSLADIPPNPPFLIVPLSEGADARAIAGLLCSGDAAGPDRRDPKERGPSPFNTCMKINNVVFAGNAAVYERVSKMTAMPRPELVTAFEAAGDTTAQLLFIPTDENRRVVSELLPRLPPQVGGGEATVLSRGVQWMAIGAGTPPQLSLRVVIQSQDAAAAKVLHAAVTKGLDWVAAQPQARMVFPNLDALRKLFTPELAGDRMTISVNSTNDGAATFLAALAVPVQQSRNAAQRAQSMNNLKQLGLAMHYYHDTHRSFPASASYDAQGKPLLSWRVHILPYLEQDSLYKEFHLDEPWDSEHNQKLIERMPAVLRSPSSKAAPGMTTYLVPVGDKTIFPGKGKRGVPVSQITDGTSNTILLVDTRDDLAVTWTKPDDWKFDSAAPANGLVGHYENVFLATFADGSVRALKQDTKDLQAYFTRNGAEAISNN